jgi:hypothetical protein
LALDTSQKFRAALGGCCLTPKHRSPLSLGRGTLTFVTLTFDMTSQSKFQSEKIQFSVRSILPNRLPLP